MTRALVLAIVLSVWCAACVRTSGRYAGHYDRAQHIYTLKTIGLRLTLPPSWLIRTKRHQFTVPLVLRPDQEQVLEAYDASAKLGLVIVVQPGPVAAIAELVQRMQAMPETHLHDHMADASATSVRQLSLEKISVNKHDAAAWIYTATDTTGGRPVDTTVSFYILKVREHYVYLTFSTPAAAYESAKPTIESVLRTVTLSEAQG